MGARRSNPYAVVSWLAGIAGVLREGNKQLNTMAGNLETKFSTSSTVNAEKLRDSGYATVADAGGETDIAHLREA